MDYASWVKGLSAEQIQTLANNYLEKNGPLEDAFFNRFKIDLPESLNEEHEILLVASEIDSSSQRIINYLSETYGVGINAVTFNYFKDANQEYLAQTFLIEPSKAEYQQKIKSKSKR